MDSCEEMFFRRPSVLYDSDTFYPSSNCKSNKINSIMRLLLVFIIIEAIIYMFKINNNHLFVTVPLFLVLLIPVFVRMKQFGVIDTEGFKVSDDKGYGENGMAASTAAVVAVPVDAGSVGLTGGSKVAVASGSVAAAAAADSEIFTNSTQQSYKEYVIGTSKESPWTEPTASNPFMNIQVPDYKYSPNKPAALSISDPTVKQSLDDMFRTQWYSDPTDVFGKTQSQRQFITMPSTSIPNDRESYQNWLYKIPGKTCKEGGRAACLPGTDGSPVTWLNLSK
jgi:hypothetical protein